MAKFYAYVIRKDMSDRNGGSIVLMHHGHALEDLGHEFGGMLDLGERPPKDADFIMFQSEWWRAVKGHKNHSNAKWICWLGHVFPHRKYDMPKISEIEADYFHTQWQGKLFDYANEMLERRGHKLHYLPHGGCSCNTEGIKIDCPKTVFIGTDYPERAQDWLDYAKVNKITCPIEDAKNYYKSAIVSPNLHGDFQKDMKTDFTQLEGRMINDRIFNVILSGGFTISDNAEIVKEFFNEDEIPYAKSRAAYRSMVQHYTAYTEQREPFMKKAKKKILENYMYTIYWKKFLKEIGI